MTNRVTNDEWITHRGGSALSFEEAFGPSSEEEAETVDEEVAPPKRRRASKQKAQAESALTSITGLDLAIGGETEDATVDTDEESSL
jgi:hypothetical protein